MSEFLKRPCGKCPFRHDVTPYIRASRGEEIQESLESGALFPCHETVEYDEDGEGGVSTRNSSFCAGALILMEKEWGDEGGAAANQTVRILGRLNPEWMKLDELDLAAPVYDDFESWLDCLAEHECDLCGDTERLCGGCLKPRSICGAACNGFSPPPKQIPCPSCSPQPTEGTK